jgi:addiction module HigA family antidote
MVHSCSLIYVTLREIAWSRCEVIEKGNIAFVSTTSIEYVLCGENLMPRRSKLRTITNAGSGPRGRRNVESRLPPIHPGEMLREEFLVPMGLSANALALAIRVPVTRVSEIVNERRGITADTALRLARYFRMTPEFWMNIQSHYDLEMARDAKDRMIRESIQPAPQDKRTGALKLAATA